MGWFDDDDDEEEEELETKQKTSVNIKDNINNNEEEEEEDPLDAYMKSIEQNVKQNDTASSSHHRERLDMDNEDEATSHWEHHHQALHTPYNVMDHNGPEQEDADDRYQTLPTISFHAATTKKSDNNLKLTPVDYDDSMVDPPVKSFWNAADTTRGHEWRRAHQVTCRPGTIDPMYEMTECRTLFGQDWHERVTKNYSSLTPVQAQTLPVLLSGHDALITAMTGSGKSLAYVWPMVIHLVHQPPLAQGQMGPMAIVLVPTRELSLQVHKHVKSNLSLEMTSLSITGGISNFDLLKNLTKVGACHVIVATPGRLLDLLSSNQKKNKGLSLSRVSFLVLDECDLMLNMGFEPQVQEILNNVGPHRQLVLTSATISHQVERVANYWLISKANNDAVFRIAVGRTGQATQHVEQHVLVLPDDNRKREWLMEMLPILTKVGKTIVFVATKTGCEELATAIVRHHDGLRVETLHGDKHQVDRNAALKSFSKNVQVLIATNVAARGLHLINISTIINFDPAKTYDWHIHRIGRAGRLSSGEYTKGVAYTLLTPKNKDFARVLVHALEREGRDVSTELRALAQTSRHSDKVTFSPKRNRSGLGYHDDDDDDNETNNTNNYGPLPNASFEPSAKRSRWA